MESAADRTCEPLDECLTSAAYRQRRSRLARFRQLQPFRTSRKRSVSTRVKRERHACCCAMGVELALGIDNPPLRCRDPCTTMGDLTLAMHEAGAYRDRSHEMCVQLQRCEPVAGGKCRMHGDAHGGIEKGASDAAMDGADNIVMIFRRIELYAGLARLHQHEAEADELAYWCGWDLAAHDHAIIFEPAYLARNIQSRMRVDPAELPAPFVVHMRSPGPPSHDHDLVGQLCPRKSASKSNAQLAPDDSHDDVNTTNLRRDLWTCQVEFSPARTEQIVPALRV